MTLHRSLHIGRRASQRGITTLAVTLLLLAIVTVIAIFSTNTAFYELRTTNSENRARLAEQAAEYGVNLGGEYIKSQLANLVSGDAGGWLAAGAELWTACSSVSPLPAGHPCRAEVDEDRRAQMYFRELANDGDGTDTNDVADLIAAGSLANVGGTTAAFPVQTTISALLCRIDTSDVDDPQCRLTPTSGNNVAVTIVATGNLTGESATATVKETWASYGSFNPASTVPLVASGTVQGLGNAQIVASPNAGGTGLAASIWSPGNVDIEAGGGGVGSVSTCHLGGFLGHGEVPVDDLLTTCAESNNACGCPSAGDPDFISGHSQAVKREGLDVLDVDGSSGSADLPDIEFFPGNGMDSSADPSDDNLFEWIFNVNYVAEADGCNENNAGNCSEDAGTGLTDADCGTGNDEDCAVYAMREELGFELVTCAQLNALGEEAEGLYYVTDSANGGGCDLGDQIGSPDNDVVVVIDDEVRVGAKSVLYGMLFVRSADNTALMTGNGNAQIFGSTVVQGNVDIKGGIDIIYYDWGAEGNDPDDPPPPARYFGRVGGSWLDDDDGF